MKRTSAALVAVVLSGVAACGSGGTSSPSNEPLVSGDRVNPATLKDLTTTFAKQDVAAQQRQVADLDLSVERALWKLSGLDAAVGADPDAVFKAANEEARVQLAARAGTARAFGRSVVRTDELSEARGAAMFGALMLGSMYGEVAVNLTGEEKSGTENGTTIKATKSGASATTTMKNTVQGVDMAFELSADVQTCPDAQGKVVLKESVRTSVSKGGAGFTRTTHVTVDATVDDKAEVAESTYETRQESADFAAGGGSYVDVTVKPDGTATLQRTGGKQNDTLVRDAAKEAAFSGALIAFSLLDKAKAGWQSGRCVQLNAEPSAGPSGLSPSQSLSVTAQPRSKVDGAAVGGTVTTKLTGGSSIDPAEAKADATFTYVAPGEDKKRATLALEARSRRGIGRATIDFDTYRLSYRAVGGMNDFQADGVICSLEKPFKLRSGGLTMRFTPAAGGGGGTWVQTGRAGGVAWSGGGGYTVKLDGSGNTGTLTAQGVSTIATPAGNFSGNVKPVFKLSVVAGCS